MGYAAVIDAPVQAGVWGDLDLLVAELAEARAAVAAAQSRESVLLARAVDLVLARSAERRAQGLTTGNDLPLREVSAELGAAMRVSDRTVQRRIDDAHTLVGRFPATLQAWMEGLIDRAHVAVIVDEGALLSDPDARRRFEEHVLRVAEVESATRLRGIARIVAARIDPEVSAKRRSEAVRARGVRVFDLAEGMSRLQADLPSPLAHAIKDRLDQFGRTVLEAERAECDGQQASQIDRESVESRGLDEVRADVLTDLLLTAVPTAHHGTGGTALSGVRGEVNITIPIATAAGLGDEPATLAGCGPIDAGLARRMLAAAPSWNRVLVDLPTGLPVAVDRYRPSAELRRFIDYRDEHCRFPGCIVKPWRCDADHTIDAARGGPTTQSNLADFCRRHHTLKHTSPWRVEQIGGGDLKWTSPTGRIYPDRVPAAVMFVPSLEVDVRDTSDPPPF